MQGWPVPPRPRPGAHVVEQDGRAVGVGLGTLAAQLVQAIALAMALVAEFQGEAAGVEMGAAFAVFMDQTGIGEFGPALVVHRRQLAEGQEVDHGGQEVIGVGRTAGDGDHRLGGQDLGHAGGAGRIGRRGRHAAPGRAGADGDHRRGTLGAFLDQIQGGLAADLAVDAVVLDRDGALDHQDILAPVLLHGGFAGGLDLMAGGGEQGLVIIQRDDLQDQLLDGGMFRPKHGLGTAGALLEVQPDHAGALLGGDGLDDLGFRPLGQTHGRGHGGAELEEVAALDVEAVRDLAGNFGVVVHCPPPCLARRAGEIPEKRKRWPSRKSRSRLCDAVTARPVPALRGRGGGVGAYHQCRRRKALAGWILMRPSSAWQRSEKISSTSAKRNSIPSKENATANGRRVGS